MRILAAATLAMVMTGAAESQRRDALTMMCHPLIRGVPSKEPTVYTVTGRTMYARVLGQTRRISLEGAPVPLGRSVDRGVPTLSWADHRRAGSIVTRRVWWKTGAAPRRLAFTERYDFAARRITGSDDPSDSCHADGR